MRHFYNFIIGISIVIGTLIILPAQQVNDLADLTGIDAGDGIRIDDPNTATPEVNVKIDTNGPLGFDADGLLDFTGTLTPANLGTGTPTASHWLRGDGAWASPIFLVDVEMNSLVSRREYSDGAVTSGSWIDLETLSITVDSDTNDVDVTTRDTVQCRAVNNTGESLTITATSRVIYIPSGGSDTVISTGDSTTTNSTSSGTNASSVDLADHRLNNPGSGTLSVKVQGRCQTTSASNGVRMLAYSGITLEEYNSVS